MVIDESDVVFVFMLETKAIEFTYKAPGHVTAIESDPSLDWLFLGLENGQIVVFDIDRGVQAPFRIGNLQKSVLAKLRMSPVRSLALHPRDPGTLLVCYDNSAIIFSLAKNEIENYVRYEVPAGAPGGDLTATAMKQFRFPDFVKAVWHPHGHHFLTAHQDGSLVFWDTASATLLQARTLVDTFVNEVRKSSVIDNSQSMPGSHRRIISDLKWVSTKNPEDTSILVSGGEEVMPGFAGDRVLTMLDFGPTPQVAITSYQNMGNHYANPRKHKMFPLMQANPCDTTKILMLPRTSPYYAGNHDPSHCLVLFASGEIMTLRYPDGNVVTNPALLPPALGWVNPFVTCLASSFAPRNQWLGMMAVTSRADTIFIGGAPAKRHLRSQALRQALATGHEDGTIKIWDASSGELEDSNVLEARMVTHQSVDKLSLAAGVGEIAAADANGDVVLFNFRKNKGVLNLAGLSLKDGPVRNVSSQAPQDVKEGFLPEVLISNQCGRVTALCNSNVGFVGIGYESGQLAVIDRRGPAQIFFDNVGNVDGGSSSLLRKRSSARGSVGGSGDYPTCIEFGIYAIGNDEFSSIVMSVGTQAGNVLTYRLIPQRTGGYAVEAIGTFNVAPEPLIALAPLDVAVGKSAVAQSDVMSQLSSGIVIPGALLAVTAHEARIFRQPGSKVSHKKFAFNAISAGLCYLREGDSLALVCITDASEYRVMAIPSLRDVVTRKLPFELFGDSSDTPHNVRPRRPYPSDSIVARMGDLFVRSGRSTAAMINIWGRGMTASDIPQDHLYDAMKALPPRPTISTVQWVRGRQYITVEDLDNLLGGPRRPKNRRKAEMERNREEQARLVDMKKTSSRREAEWSRYESDDAESSNSRFGGISAAFNNLEQSTNEYVDSLGDMIKNAKNNAVKSSLKSSLRSKFF